MGDGRLVALGDVLGAEQDGLAHVLQISPTLIGQLTGLCLAQPEKAKLEKERQGLLAGHGQEDIMDDRRPLRLRKSRKNTPP